MRGLWVYLELEPSIHVNTCRVLTFLIMSKVYIKVDWPESQMLMELKDEYLEQLIPIDNMGYMVPGQLYDDYLKNPTEYLKD